MKKYILTLLFLLVAVTGMDAQIFWKISGDGLDRPSYLLGTHHLAPVAVLDSLPGFDGILESVDLVYGELVMSDAMSPSSQQLMAKWSVAPADSTLSRILSPVQMDSLTEVLRHYMGPQVSAAAFGQLKPSMVNTVLAMAQTQAAFPDFDPSRQLDAEVQRRAQGLGKPVAGLETMEQQCAVLFGGSIASQAADLLDFIRNENYSLAMVRKLADAYMAGDIDAILSIMEDPVLSSPETTERLIEKRNADWMRILSALLPTASMLIVVGAGHLPGEKGLISLLRKQGYTVEKQ